MRRGLLPQLLSELLTERKRVKRLMAVEQDPLRRTLLDSKQLALKVSANSIYGACGARRGLLSCVEVAKATTGAGRHLILFTREHIEASWPGARVVYGDTDSCFVVPPPCEAGRSPTELFELGEAMAASVTRAFAATVEDSAVKLEVEKFLRPLILYKKKRYVGLCFEDPQKPGKLFFRGLELVRRDAIPLVRETQRLVLRELLDGAGPDAAVAHVRAAVRRVLALGAGEGLEALRAVAYSKTLKASYADRDAQAHVRVAALMDERVPGSAPRVGERVEYVVVASETARVVDKVEDVAYAAARALPIDWVHYVEAVQAPVSRLLDVPLQSLAPELLEELRRFFEEAAARAVTQVRDRSLARHGAAWVFGHVARGGGAQLKLTFGARTAPAAPKKRRLAGATDAGQTTLAAFLVPSPLLSS